MSLKNKHHTNLFGIFKTAPKDWSEKQIVNFAIEKKEKYDERRKAPVLSMTKHKGFMNSKDYFKKPVHSKDLKNYKLVQKEDFAYATIHLDEGSIGYLEDFDLGYVSPMYTVFQINKTVNPHYLLYVIKSESFIKKFVSLGRSSIKRRNSISFDRLKTLFIPYPKIEEQNKIMETILKFEFLINLHKKKIDCIKKLKTEMIFKLVNTTIYKEGTNEKFGTICKKRKNFDLKSKTHVGLENIEKDTNILLEKENAEDYKTKRPFNEGDVLYGKLRPYLNKVWLADCQGFCSTDIYALECEKSCLNTYLLFFLSSPKFLEFTSSLTRGNLPRVRWSQIENFELHLPSVTKQKEISKILINIQKLLERQSKFYSKLKIAKEEASRNLISGEYRLNKFKN